MVGRLLDVSQISWRTHVADLLADQEHENGCHALRHFYTSTLLEAGETIKALSEYLGHSDPGFTLRTYTHLMASSHDRTRKAIDAVLGQASKDQGAAGQGV